MAFSYGDLTRIKNEITSDTESLGTLFNEFTSIVNENVNNDQVWHGSSSMVFKQRWDTFSGEKFPEYKNHFNKEIDNLVASISAYQRSEGN